MAHSGVVSPLGVTKEQFEVFSTAVRSADQRIEAAQRNVKGLSSGASMSRNQITITLSDRADKDYRQIAKKLGMPVATLLRQILEQTHQSPTIGALLRRCEEVYKNDDVELDDE